MLGSNSRSFNPAAAPKVTLSFPLDNRRADARFPAPFTRRPPIIVPGAWFVLHVREASRLVCVRGHGRRTFFR
jgi:hypothetical protein